jgi:hypothetical protein
VALSEADFVNYRELDRTVPSVIVRNARDINSKYEPGPWRCMVLIGKLLLRKDKINGLILRAHIFSRKTNCLYAVGNVIVRAEEVAIPS